MAGTTAYNLQIVTPEGHAFVGEVRSVVLPGADGSFGILATHAPLLSALQVGTLEMEDASGNRETWAIGEGFVEVVAEGTKVLTDFTNKAGEVDVPRAEAARERAQQLLDQSLETTDRARAEAAMRRAMLRLRLSGKTS